jgi:hypothetical protein
MAQLIRVLGQESTHEWHRSGIFARVSGFDRLISKIGESREPMRSFLEESFSMFNESLAKATLHFSPVKSRWT